MRRVRISTAAILVIVSIGFLLACIPALPCLKAAGNKLSAQGNRGAGDHA